MSDRGARILHVDDDEIFRKFTGALLTHAGNVVVSATDGQDAWDRIVADWGGFDLVITDLQMPNLDGWWLVQLLCERNFPGRIVVFSGSLDADTTDKFLGLGVDAVVHKGGGAGELLAAVKSVTRESVTAKTEPHLRVKADRPRRTPAQFSRHDGPGSGESAAMSLREV